MLIKEKTRTMTRMAIFEDSKEGRRVLRTSHFFRTDYIRWEILKTILSVTIGYLVILVLIVLYNLEYLIKNATKLDYKGLSFRALGFYVILLVVYGTYTLFTSAYRYRVHRKKFASYSRLLKQMKGFYEEGPTEEEQNDTAIGDKR